MKRPWILFAAGATICASVLCLSAVPQARPDVQPLATLMPRGAVLYLQARDFSELLREWNASPVKQQWLKSDNYDVFSRSRLVFRLEEAQKQFALTAGVPPNLNFLVQAAGGESALAIYDIGKLEFLYVTKVPSGRAMQSALWDARRGFEARSAAGTPFYVHTNKESGRTVAFAITGDYLLLATREDLLASSLESLSGAPVQTISGEGWFSDATASAGDPGELRLVLNMEKIAAAPHFRSYWIQQNVSDMRRYAATISDLRREASAWREERVLLPEFEGQPPEGETAEGERQVANLSRLVPDDAGMYRATANPSLERTFALLNEKIFRLRGAQTPPSKVAPLVSLNGGEVGDASDFETRIDQTVDVPEVAEDSNSPLRRAIEKTAVQAQLEVQSARADATSSFVEISSAIVLAGATDWDADTIRDAVAKEAQHLADMHEPHARWLERGQSSAQFFQLQGFFPLDVALRGKILVISNDEPMMSAILAKLDAKPADSTAAYAAGFNHALNREAFARLSAALDHSNDSQTQGGTEPAFFGGNVVSLSRVLSGLNSVSIVESKSGGRVKQIVTYRWTP